MEMWIGVNKTLKSEGIAFCDLHRSKRVIYALDQSYTRNSKVLAEGSIELVPSLEGRNVP